VGDAGHVFHISPGGSETLNFVVGTASCEPGAGYVVWPGRYEVIVLVDLVVEGGGALPGFLPGIASLR
jgi:hypothetical protein